MDRENTREMERKEGEMDEKERRKGRIKVDGLSPSGR